MNTELEELRDQLRATSCPTISSTAPRALRNAADKRTRTRKITGVTTVAVVVVGIAISPLAIDALDSDGTGPTRVADENKEIAEPMDRTYAPEELDAAITRLTEASDAQGWRLIALTYGSDRSRLQVESALHEGTPELEEEMRKVARVPLTITYGAELPINRPGEVNSEDDSDWPGWSRK